MRIDYKLICGVTPKNLEQFVTVLVFQNEELKEKVLEDLLRVYPEKVELLKNNENELFSSQVVNTKLKNEDTKTVIIDITKTKCEWQESLAISKTKHKHLIYLLSVNSVPKELEKQADLLLTDLYDMKHYTLNKKTYVYYTSRTHFSPQNGVIKID